MVWVIAGWIAVSLLLALAFALGAGIGYRRGQEDAERSENRTIRVDEEQPNLPEQPARRRAS